MKKKWLTSQILFIRTNNEKLQTLATIKAENRCCKTSKSKDRDDSKSVAN